MLRLICLNLIGVFFFLLMFIDIRLTVMFFTPDFILFNNFLYFPIICFVNILDTLQGRKRPVVDCARYFSKLGKVRKVGWRDNGQYYLIFRIKNMEPKITVLVQDNGNWQLVISGHFVQNPDERKFLNSAGIKGYSGTLEDIAEIVAEGKGGALVNML